MFLAQLLLMLAFVSNATPTPDGGDPPSHINVCNFSFGPNAGNCEITAANTIWDQMNGGKTTAQCRVEPDVYSTIVANLDTNGDCFRVQVIVDELDFELIVIDRSRDTMMVIYNSTMVPILDGLPSDYAPITDFHYSTPDLGGNDDTILPENGGITGNVQVCNYGIPISSTSPCVNITSTANKGYESGPGWYSEIHCSVDEADLSAINFARSENCLVNEGYFPGNLTYIITTAIFDTKRRTTLILDNAANNDDPNTPSTLVSIDDYKLS